MRSFTIFTPPTLAFVAIPVTMPIIPLHKNGRRNWSLQEMLPWSFEQHLMLECPSIVCINLGVAGDAATNSMERPVSMRRVICPGNKPMWKMTGDNCSSGRNHFRSSMTRFSNAWRHFLPRLTMWKGSGGGGKDWKDWEGESQSSLESLRWLFEVFAGYSRVWRRDYSWCVLVNFMGRLQFLQGWQNGSQARRVWTGRAKNDRVSMK